LPNAFNQIPLGTLMGTLFFIGFYVAAVTSSAGVMESIVGLLMDQFKLKRLPALGLTVLGMGGIGAACIFSDDLFNWLDLVENNYILTLGALVISIFVGWVWGADNFVAATNVKSKFFQVWLKVTVKYVSPIAILVIFVGSFFS
ncbi:MAG: hypothetical protein LBI99_10165, partial [Propionibacteriaceae bacterium]|nr:hypothetical protein [Propionibacteriaceae bacterium]